MTEIKPGDTVRITYTGTLEDGSVFDSSEGREPLQFQVGSGQIIPGLDKHLPGMKAGDSKSVTVSPDEAYGPHNPEGLQAIDRGQFPPEIPLETGTPLQVQTPDGRTLPVQIADVTDDEVIVDTNHPLAGKALIFAFTVESMTPAEG